MTPTELVALSPFLCLGAFVVLTLLVIAVRRDPRWTALCAAIGLVASGGLLFYAAGVTPRLVTPLVAIDDFALLYTGVFLAAALATVALAHGDLLRRPERNREEFHVLVLLATLGAATLAASRHFASFFLGLETLSVSLYALIAYPRSGARSVEAGLKYLVIAGASSAILLFGMALIYADLGALDFTSLALRIRTGAAGLLIIPGMTLLVAGSAFKLAVAPFHMWTPDVYQGAPAPVTGFLATVSKGAMLALLLRFYLRLDGDLPFLRWSFALLAIASMFAGNLIALFQTSVKRLLAGSSIAHLGYVMVAFVAAGAAALEAVTWYVVAYFLTTLAAFGVITVLSDGEAEADELGAWRGLLWRRPWLAGLMAASLLSLAGIPLTAGFLAKFYVLAAGAAADLWFLVLILVVNSAIGVFYYLRVVVAMIARPAAPPAPAAPRPTVAASVTLGVLGVLLIGLGVYPAALQRLLEATLTALL